MCGVYRQMYFDSFRCLEPNLNTEVRYVMTQMKENLFYDIQSMSAMMSTFKVEVS